MGDYERQHWVPQTYLRRFSPDGARILMFDKPTGRVARPNIRDVARGKHFNDGFLRGSEGSLPPEIPEAALEEQFSRWESVLAQVTEAALRVAAGGSAGLQERRDMATCVALQIARTPAFRRRLATWLSKEIEERANAHLAQRFPDAAKLVRAVPTFPKEWAGALQAYFIWNTDQIPAMAADLYQYIWRVGLNHTTVPLCTSDSPVVIDVHDATPASTQGGCTAPEQDVVRRVLIGDRGMTGVEVILPLTPEVVLLMYHPEHFAALGPTQGLPLELTQDQVMHYNALQLLYAERQLYSRSDVFLLVRECAAKYDAIEFGQPDE